MVSRASHHEQRFGCSQLSCSHDQRTRPQNHDKVVAQKKSPGDLRRGSRVQLNEFVLVRSRALSNRVLTARGRTVLVVKAVAVRAEVEAPLWLILRQKRTTQRHADAARKRGTLSVPSVYARYPGATHRHNCAINIMERTVPYVIVSWTGAGLGWVVPVVALITVRQISNIPSKSLVLDTLRGGEKVSGAVVKLGRLEIAPVITGIAAAIMSVFACNNAVAEKRIVPGKCNAIATDHRIGDRVHR